MAEITDKTERTESSKLIFDGKVVHLYFDEITLPNGAPATREYIRHIGAVCVLPLTDTGDVICVKQYRYPFAGELLELPAGKLDSKSENRAEAALRELREETGARCERLTHIAPFYPSPAISDEVIDLYLAEGLTFGETDFDEDEFIDTVKIPLQTLTKDILSGKIPDGKTQALVLAVNELLRRRKEET